MPAADVSGDAPRARALARWWSRVRVVVRDESMLPSLRPGDRLWVDRTAYRDRVPRAGEIVVFPDPEAPDRWLVKRVATTAPEGLPSGTVFVLSDGPGPTRDSRRFGPVATDRLIGRAYRRYFPAERRGDL